MLGNVCVFVKTHVFGLSRDSFFKGLFLFYMYVCLIVCIPLAANFQ